MSAHTPHNRAAIGNLCLTVLLFFQIGSGAVWQNNVTTRI
jgi:hypothetical protein